MEQIKRQRETTTEDSDDMKRKKFHSAHQPEDSFNINLFTKSISYFEDLCNEIIYEIFEYFDFDYIYETFSSLNQRFVNLTINSNLPIQINTSCISKSNFQHNISKLTRLETLIFTNISSSYLRNLQYLINLPKLSSLTITNDGYTKTEETEFCHQIFQLPVLKYCSILLGMDYTLLVSSLPFATNKYSLIEDLVIKNYIPLDTLYTILSYTPHIRRLSLSYLVEPEKRQNMTFSITLNNLTYISLKLTSFDFHHFELLAKDLFHNLQVLRLYASSEITYLDANRWQNLILSHIPNLTIFDFQYVYFLWSRKDMLPTYKNLIQKFTSSFWIERQWFFSTQYPPTINKGTLIFFSVKPYKRTTFRLSGIMEEKLNFDSVHHINIQNINTIKSCRNYFPNTTKLTLTSRSPSICNSINDSLRHIISPEQLTELVIEEADISFMVLVKLLSVAVNLHTVKLEDISNHEINPVIIQKNEIFQLVSEKNVIKNLTLTYERSLEKVELLLALCPRLQHFALHHDFGPF
ncbi:unnamed protein product [Adineta steineri]|uniref:F-box domain-containing protein n=1 Tax=Adineta steineri TaxID=433720 RepID=A0A815R5M6_9BILA|nr:unnamed protein product [Adineta steineri]CAF3990290.1 unnamed protein product [Adineta steineri]